MRTPVPGDMVMVAPKDQLTGYLITPALFIGEEWEDAGEHGAYSVYLVFFKGKTVKVPTRSHKVEVLEEQWGEFHAKVIGEKL